MARLTQMTIRVDEEERDWLLTEASKRGLSFSEWVREVTGLEVWSRERALEKARAAHAKRLATGDKAGG
ncbi:MAG TPA: hypothetical protein VD948_03010 [Rhodothermales bacterium]|nr:hypothetical protein [Rhodothermales bacterium]